MSSTRIPLRFSCAEKYLPPIVATAASLVLTRLLTPEGTGSCPIGSMLAGPAHVLPDIGVGQDVVQARLDVLAALVRIGAVPAGALGGLAGGARAVSGSAMFRTWWDCRYLRARRGLGAADLLRACARGTGLAVAWGVAGSRALRPGQGALVALLLAGSAAGVAWLGGLMLLRHPLGRDLQAVCKRAPNVLFA